MRKVCGGVTWKQVENATLEWKRIATANTQMWFENGKTKL